MTEHLTPAQSLEAIRDASAGLEEMLDAALKERVSPATAPLYHMLRYFMGFVEADGSPGAKQAGKRFRSSLCLYLAASYDVRDKALDAAVAIELFHNFTLIHDDVVDQDTTRRGRPTVWSVWGSDHAINSGDVQSLIASDLCARAAIASGVGVPLSRVMFDGFIEVGEGQYLDFELAKAPLASGAVSEAAYVAMIEKKSGVLVRVAAEVAGRIARRGEGECAALRAYGMALGTAYQMADDYRSVWNSASETGKDIQGDIREHKRTYPFIAALAALSGEQHARLEALYELPRQLTPAEVDEAFALITATDARTKTLERIRARVQIAKDAVLGVGVSPGAQEVLLGAVDALVPEAGKDAEVERRE